MEYVVGKSFCEFLGEKGEIHPSLEEIFKTMEPIIKSVPILYKKSEEKKESERGKQRETIKNDKIWQKDLIDRELNKNIGKKINIWIFLGAVFLLILVAVALLSQNRSRVVTADDILSNNIVLLDENISVGDTVSFGKNNREWIVLDKKEDRALLFAKESVGQRQYHTTYEDITWEKCSLRQWLNYDFYNDSFSEVERERICEVVVKNPDNSEYGTEGGNDIEDKIFLLSLDEAEKYFEDEMARAIGTSWWLRSPGNNSEFAAEVLSDGSLNPSGFTVDPESAVRPALWVKMES